VAFAVDRLGFTPDDWQRECLHSTGQSIPLNCCRQARKSTTTAIIALHQAFYWPGSPAPKRARGILR